MLGSGEHRGAEQTFLVAEEVVDHRDVDSGVARDLSDRRPLIAVTHEVLKCRVDDALFVLLTGAPPTGAPRFGHVRSVLQRMLMYCEGSRILVLEPVLKKEDDDDRDAGTTTVVAAHPVISALPGDDGDRHTGTHRGLGRRADAGCGLAF